MSIPTLRLAVIGLILPLSLFVSFLMVSVVFATGVHEEIGSVLAAVSLLLCLAVGGGLWARALTPARLRTRRIILAAAICHPVVMFIALQGLGELERQFVENGGTTLPLHVLYTLLFVPATFLTSGILSLAMTVAAGRAVRTAFLLPPLGSAVAYLVLNVLQDLLGRRVGGPNAGETATMITVTLACVTCSAMVFTMLLGRLLYATSSGIAIRSARVSPDTTALTTQQDLQS